MGEERQVPRGSASRAFAEASAELGASASGNIVADSLSDKPASVAFRCDTVDQANRLFGKSNIHSSMHGICSYRDRVLYTHRVWIPVVTRDEQTERRRTWPLS